MTLQDYLAAGALVAGVPALPAAWAAWSSWRTVRRGGGKDRFRGRLQSLRDNQMSLTRRMLAASPADFRQPGLPVLTRPEWTQVVPFDLAEVKFEWLDGHLDDVAGFRRVSAKVLTRVGIAPITRYSTALIEIAGLTRLFDGVIYRLVDVELTADTKKMVFTKSTVSQNGSSSTSPPP